jgi:hypothetical protein
MLTATERYRLNLAFYDCQAQGRRFETVHPLSSSRLSVR